MYHQGSNVLERYLERSLRKALPVTGAKRWSVPPGPGAKDGVITTCRFILVLKGTLEYTVEGQDYRFDEGMHFLVPAWCRRWWSVPEGKNCEIIWCEFDDDPSEIRRGGCLSRQLLPAELKREKKHYLDILHLWKELHGLREAERQLKALELEGALKAMLSRFIPQVETHDFKITDSARLHPEIKQALVWLGEHYADPKVLESLSESIAMTPNYFRVRFKEALSCSPGEYVKQLRLRQARHLLYATDWQLKRIAIEVGYLDPLYFSRIYRSFWGINPSQERSSLMR